MAQTDFILDIDGVEGESTQSGFEGKIDVQSWSWSESNAGSHGTGGGGGTGKVAMGDISIVVEMSKASPALFLACAKGDHFDTAKIICRKAGGDAPVKYLTIELKKVGISSYTTGASNGSGVLPMDSFTLNFDSINFEYIKQAEAGGDDSTTSKGFDLGTGQQL